MSGADCYGRAGDWTGAINLYRGALAGPLMEHTRQEVEQRLAECLAELVNLAFPTAPWNQWFNALGNPLPPEVGEKPAIEGPCFTSRFSPSSVTIE